MLRCSPAVAEKLQSRSPSFASRALALPIVPKVETTHAGCSGGCGGGLKLNLSHPAVLIALGALVGAVVVIAVK